MSVIKGTIFGDTLYGTAAADTINGLGGNDQLKGYAGADRLDGGLGIDTAFYSDSTSGVAVNLARGLGFGGSAEGDTLFSIENLFGSSYNDQLIGDDGDNALNGLGGADILIGGDGSDTLDGGSGDDTLKGGGGADTLIGGPGIDTVDYSDANSDYTISLASGHAGSGVSIEDQLSGIENATGTSHQDHMIGDGGANVLRGNAGGDVLDGGGGADIMYGGADGDEYHIDNVGDLALEYAGEGTDRVITTISYTLSAGSEIEWFVPHDYRGTAALNLTGNEFNNIIWGTFGDNIIDGGGGADNMTGWFGNDTYIVDNPGDTPFENVDQGFDTLLTSVNFNVGLYSEMEVIRAIGTADIDLVGSIDNNTIIGNDGQNTIVGSYGKDTLTGGGGGDVFVWSGVEEIGRFNFDPDIVTDFDRGVGDLLAFNPIDADTTVAGNQAFTFVDTAPFTGPGQINWFTNGVDTFIQLNVDADLTVDGIIQVFGVHTPDASWFVL